ncbi:hypothetical protein GS682_22640 [Nostoc sp. B(2019)]|uniref:Uncharacterized protein n=1 Tax=Nostoc cf. edaphicum LEGE 07299 TaxID=2777974 RepID=A0ABR9U1R4_9NOSO|nr:hypothetical protein [Nostoc edaphicum]MBE9106606.1 hypothetical protein [Nostoc cf. edaphicum LEGE 07299]NDJ24389.1 hypothetical protein [Nostoc sp. B(2019)]
MSDSIITSDLLVNLSTQEQQLLSGGYHEYDKDDDYNKGKNYDWYGKKYHDKKRKKHQSWY